MILEKIESIRPNIKPRSGHVAYASEIEIRQKGARSTSHQTWNSNQNVFILHTHPPPSAVSELQGVLALIGEYQFGSNESVMRCRETFDCEIDQPNSLRRSIDNSGSFFLFLNQCTHAYFFKHNTQTNYIKNYEFNYPQTQSFFTVTCVSGHLTELEFYDTHRRWNACDSFDLFDAPVEIRVPADKKAIEQNLLNQARRADVLMIWTDCDREGEHIGMEIAKVCRKAKSTIRIKRARFSAIIPQYAALVHFGISALLIMLRQANSQCSSTSSRTR